jgi:hypothetical protein
MKLQADSKLLSLFPWPIIFKPEEQNNLLTEYESVTQNFLFGSAIIAVFDALID